MGYQEDYLGTEKRVRISQGNRVIDFRVIGVLLYTCITFSFLLRLMILSRPLKAPDAMNRMLVVSTCTISPFNLREFLSGTLTTVPSNIFKKPCCTPSPPTSRSWCIPGTLPILSTSSKNMIPEINKAHLL